jgi:hypothetical protein
LIVVRYWIGVVPRDQVRGGVEGRFAQLSRGEEAPLKRMRAGDWLVYYSSRIGLQDRDKCQSFTAICHMADNEVYPFVTAEGFVFFRRNVRYLACREAPIHPLLGRLSFVLNKKHWGYPFRAGHFEITPEDFHVIATTMSVDLSSTDFSPHSVPF